MQKMILALLLCISCSAHASWWFETANTAGGKILLLPTKCQGSESGRLVIATTPTGATVHGCWYLFADLFHVLWNNGGASSYDPSIFEYRKEGKTS